VPYGPARGDGIANLPTCPWMALPMDGVALLWTGAGSTFGRHY